MSIARAGQAIRSGALTSVQLTEEALTRIASIDPHIHSFIVVNAERALCEARLADWELACGKDRGPLHGIPYALKDVYDVAGMATTCHSRRQIGHVASADSSVQTRLRDAGAVLLGKQATHEFALGGPSHDLPYPLPRNPWNLNHFTGGSSSGSAAGVAAGLLRVSFATDTGGSIRIPAAYCGVVGLKPTAGAVSRAGVYPLSYSLDQCGPIARSVEDAALAFRVIAAYDPEDPASVATAVPEARAMGEGGAVRRRVAYARDSLREIEGYSADVLQALDRAAAELQNLGIEVEEVALPPLELFAACQLVILTAEAFAIHEPSLRSQPKEYGRIFYQRVVPGAGLSAADLTNAFRVRRKLAHAIETDIFSRFDALMLFSAATPAPRIDRYGPDWPPRGLPLTLSTAIASVTGHPALVLPVGFSGEGLPIGIQMIGRAFDERSLLEMGRMLEASTQGGDRWPAHVA